MRLAIVGMIVGGLLIAAPARIATLLGVLLVGLSAALLIQLVPAVLTAIKSGAPAAAIGEANGLASAMSVLAPLAVSGGLAAGLGWRTGYLVAPLLALTALTLPAWRLVIPRALASMPGSSLATPAPIFSRWLDLVLAVSVEFCMVFWAASAFIDWDRASSGQAPALASLFLVGMATARALSARIIRRIPGQRFLILVCTAAALAGFTVFLAGTILTLAALGLFVAGLGTALLYPTTLSRVISAWPQAQDLAAARAALGSGLAIGIAPFLLAQISDATGLRIAFLVVPVLLLLLAVHVGIPRQRDAEDHQH